MMPAARAEREEQAVPSRRCRARRCRAGRCRTLGSVTATSYGAALALCIYLGWGIATSPIPIAALFVMLLSKDSRRTSVAYTATWFVLQFLAIAACTWAARTFIHAAPTESHQHRIGAAMVAVGVACFALAGALALWNRAHPNPARGDKTRVFLKRAADAGPKDAAILAVLSGLLNVTNVPYWVGMGLIIQRAHLAWGERMSIVIAASVAASITFIVITAAAVLATARVNKIAAWGRDKLTEHASASGPIFALTCGFVFTFLGASDLGWI